NLGRRIRIPSRRGPVTAILKHKLKLRPRSDTRSTKPGTTAGTTELSHRSRRTEISTVGQNCAILRNALRKRNYELPSVGNDMQSSETLRNSLSLNYKSAALPAELWRQKCRAH